MPTAGLFTIPTGWTFQRIRPCPQCGQAVAWATAPYTGLWQAFSPSGIAHYRACPNPRPRRRR
jgi:hypothetical protein